MRRHRLGIAMFAMLLSVSVAAGVGQAAVPDDRPSLREVLRALGDGGRPNTADLAEARRMLAGGGGTCEPGLPPSSENVDLLGRLDISEFCGGIADVSEFKGFAYLHAWAPYCLEEGRGGTFVVDVDDPTNPVLIGFIPSAEGSYPGEGGNVIHMETRYFQGDILVRNNEDCTEDLSGEGGMDIIDVTDPFNPVVLAQGVGDTRLFRGHRAHDTHQTFAWQQGKNAYAMLVDNFEQGFGDVDIMDITDPRNATKIAETGFPRWEGAQEPLAYGDQPLIHDMFVKRVDGVWTALVSYWDAGWVLLNVENPRLPKFIDDSNYQSCDPLTGLCPPEGNAHQAEWSHDNRFILGADEDFSPYRAILEITTGPNAGEYQAGQFGWVVPLADRADKMVNGPTVFGGYACTIDHRDPIPPPPPTEPGEEKILVTERGPSEDPNHPHTACFFSEKVQAAQEAGYDAVIVANHHVGAGGGVNPDAFLCGSQGHDFGEITIHGFCTGHRALHLMFNTEPNYQIPYPPEGSPEDTEPEEGAIGEDVKITATFDGWGYTHLLDAETLEEIDVYAVEEAVEEPFATDFGILSVHEITSEESRNIAYFAWYKAGFRVARFGPSGIVETGHFIDEGGNFFWGVQLGPDRTVLASDRDRGLYVFRYTGPGAP